MEKNIKTISCFAYLWEHQEKIIGALAEKFGNSSTGVKTTEIRIVTMSGECFKLVFKGFADAVPNNVKFYNNVRLGIKRKSYNQRQYSEIAHYGFDIKGNLLGKAQLKQMVAIAYCRVLKNLYDWEIITATDWVENSLMKFDKEII